MTEPVPDRPEPERPVVSDAVRLQILATEHWSLLATRSMVWNEIFTRTGMFITTLSAAAVALALVAQATEFGENFRTFALIILPVVLLLGSGTLLRLIATLEEDFFLVVGMNRLRNAYLRIAPDLEPHFVTSAHDDLLSVMQTYSTHDRVADLRVTPARVLSSTVVIVSILDCVLAGLIAALLVNLATARSGLYVTAGVLVGIAAAVVLLGVVPQRSIGRVQREYQPRFPAPAPAPEMEVVS